MKITLMPTDLKFEDYVKDIARCLTHSTTADSGSYTAFRPIGKSLWDCKARLRSHFWVLDRLISVAASFTVITLLSLGSSDHELGVNQSKAAAGCLLPMKGFLLSRGNLEGCIDVEMWSSRP